jgi:hypothetical protein
VFKIGRVFHYNSKYFITFGGENMSKSSKMKKYLCLIFSLICSSLAISQHNMPLSGSASIVCDICDIYDDGGASGNYATRVSSTMTVVSSSPSAQLVVNGNYDLELYYNTWLRIFNGSSTTGQLLFNSHSGSDTISLVAPSDTITIVFYADSDDPRTGFALHIDTCHKCPSSILGEHSLVLSDTTAVLRWANTLAGEGVLVSIDDATYTMQGNIGVFYVEDDSLFIENLEHCKTY